MNTIKKIQELATQTDDWTRRRVAEKLLESINEWQLYSARLDDIYQDQYERYALVMDSYLKHPDDIRGFVLGANKIVRNGISARFKRIKEYSESAKAHNERINEYCRFLSIWGEDRERLWEEIAQKEDN